MRVATFQHLIQFIVCMRTGILLDHTHSFHDQLSSMLAMYSICCHQV